MPVGSGAEGLSPFNPQATVPRLQNRSVAFWLPPIVLGVSAFILPLRETGPDRYETYRVLRVILIEIALLYIVAGLGIRMLLGALRWRDRARKAPPDNLCLHCGYSLIGNVSGICPECGERVSS